jgi:hypothetical protein
VGASFVNQLYTKRAKKSIYRAFAQKNPPPFQEKVGGVLNYCFLKTIFMMLLILGGVP